MPRFFTHYWKNSTCELQQEMGFEGKRFGHTAGNLFTKRKVGRGDFVYAITVRNGRLFVIGRLEVGQIISKQAAQSVFPYEVWDAADHVVALQRTGTVIRFDVAVPAKLSTGLRFMCRGRTSNPKLAGPKQLDRQTLRGVRELTKESARSLDAFLSPRR